MSMTNVVMNSVTGTDSSLSKQSRKDKSSIQDIYPVVVSMKYDTTTKATVDTELSPTKIVPIKQKRQHEQQQKQQQQQQNDVAKTREQNRMVTNDCTNTNNDEENCYKNNTTIQKQQQHNQQQEEDVDMFTNTLKKPNCSILQRMKCCCCIRTLTLLLLISLLLFLLIDTLSNGYVKSFFVQYIQWTTNNPIIGCSVYVIIYFISATILFIPVYILIALTGYVFTTIYGIVFGTIIATLVSFIGSIVSAIFQFIISRYIVRNYIQQQLPQQQQCEWLHRYRLLHSLQQSIQQQKKCGLRIVVLVRLSPINNFNVINHISGISSISLYIYCVSLLALIPGIILCSIIGTSIYILSSMSSKQYPNTSTTVPIVLCIVCIVVCALVVCVITYYTRKEIHRTAYEIQIEYSTNDQYVTHADVIDSLFDDINIIKNSNTNNSIPVSTTTDSKNTMTVDDDTYNINNSNGGVNDTFDDEYSQYTVDYNNNSNKNITVDKTTTRGQHETKCRTIE